MSSFLEPRSTRDKTITVLAVIISMAFAFGGIFVMGQAFEYPDIAAYVFLGGLLLNAFGFAIGLHIVKRFD